MPQSAGKLPVPPFPANLAQEASLNENKETLINMNGKYISEGHSVCSPWHLPCLCVYTCVEAQDPLWESSLVASPLLTGWGFQSSSELYVKDQLLHGPPSLYWNYKQVARPPSTYVSSRIQTDPHACAASSLTTKPRPQKNNGGGKKKKQTNKPIRSSGCSGRGCRLSS